MAKMGTFTVIVLVELVTLLITAAFMEPLSDLDTPGKVWLGVALLVSLIVLTAWFTYYFMVVSELLAYLNTSCLYLLARRLLFTITVY